MPLALTISENGHDTWVRHLGPDLALDQERGTRARVGYLINQPRTIGISTRVNF